MSGYRNNRCLVSLGAAMFGSTLVCRIFQSSSATQLWGNNCELNVWGKRHVRKYTVTQGIRFFLTSPATEM
jgi:hypothetical protein